MRKIVLLSIISFISLGAFSQNFSNRGNDFWLCFPSHVPNATTALPILSIYITSDQASTGTITMSNGAYTNTFSLTAANNYFQEIQINSATAQILNAESNAISKKSIRVKTDAGKPSVVVYAQQWAGARSAATLVLPTNVLGKKYYAVSSSQAIPGTSGAGASYISKSHFQIIAVKDNTIVQVTPKFNGIAQTPFTITLPLAGDTYQYEPSSSNIDVTGSYIESLASGTGGCLPIAVFTGTSGVTIGAAPCGTNPSSSDPLFQQAYPISTWGKNFGFIPFYNYLTGNPYRIMASQDNTSVYFNGGLAAILNAGDIYPNTYVSNPPVITTPTSITSDKPISVAQFMQSNACSGSPVGGSLGDPDMVILNPIEQNISDITVFSSSNQAITQRFANVLLKTNATASFKINGAAPTGTWQTFAALPGYSYLQGQSFPSTGSYHLVADSGFNAIAYGYGANESYAYSAGTNVKDLYTSVGTFSTYGIDPSSVCQGTAMKFKISLPFQPDSIYWDLSAIVNTPQYGIEKLLPPAPLMPLTLDSTTTINLLPVYWYSLPNYYTFNTPGTYTIPITLFASNADGCGSEQEKDMTFTVAAPPVPDFLWISNGCPAEPMQFNDITTSTKPTYQWTWHFGDIPSGPNDSSHLKNPTHIFTSAGPHTVTFQSITTPGCVSNTIQHIITIPTLPTATISGTTTVCINAATPNITITGTGGLAPYDFTYKLNGVVQPVVTTNASGIYTIPVPTNAATTYTYELVTVKNNGSAVCTNGVTGQLATVTVSPYVSMSMQSGVTTQTVCVNSPLLVNNTYTVTTGGTGVTLATGSLPPGVNGTFNAGVYTISGTPTASGTYTFSLQPAGGCNDPAFVALKDTIIVTANATLALQSGPPVQPVCVNNNIAPIVYLVGGGATNASVTFTPAMPGVSGSYDATTHLFTIQGAPTVAGVYNYTVNTISTCINATPLTGTITVNADASIGLTSLPPTTSQTKCINVAVDAISYSIGGSVTAVTVTPTLPTGVTYTYTPGTPGTLSILGTPTAATLGATVYTVNITGPCQVPTAMQFTLNITPDATVQLQTVGWDNQTVCVNRSISTIIYNISGSVTGATVTNLPTGVSYVYNPPVGTTPGTVVITGTPSVAGTFTYHLTVTGPCNVPAPIDGTIISNVDGTLNLSSAVGTDDQTVCVNNAIVPIKYTMGGSATTIVLTGALPPGVTWSAAGGVLTILGTPTLVTNAIMVYQYTIVTAGPCAIPTATGKITVNPNHTLQNTGTGNASQTVCSGIPITTIKYTFGGGATGVTVTGLPAGLTYVISGNDVIISGAPTTTGTYTVKTTGNACVFAQLGGTISVNALPVPDFSFSTPSCNTRTVSFTDNSIPNAPANTVWLWNFGDAPGANNTQNPTHVYATPGTYTVTLSVTNSNGCTNFIQFTKQVTINERPHTDFNVPSVACVSDIVSFTDASTFGTGAENINAYKWDFGNLASGPANTQNGKNGTHQFTAAGTFTVTHISGSVAGCLDTVSHPITISSAAVADFSVTNAAALCVNDSVAITNLSTIAVGNISKLEIYWDYTGAPGTVVTDNAPALNTVYKHKYPNFQTPANKTYTVLVRAFSGVSCTNDKIRAVTVNAVPKVQFNAMPDACYDATPFQITEASETGGVTGTGSYSGAGVSPTGLFSPKVAGIGTHVIKYTFTSIAGCVDTMSSNIKVLDTISAKFTYLSPACDGTAVTFTDVSTTPTGVTLGGEVYNTGDGNIVNSTPGATFNHTYATWGTYTVTMTTTSTYGCKSTPDTVLITVHPIPQPAFSFNQTSVCLPNAAVSFTNTSSIADNSGITYKWTFGGLATDPLNGSTAKTPPPHIYNGAGPYIVTLTAIGATGPNGYCSASVNHLVNFIHPQPKTAFDFDKPTICIGDNVTVTDRTNGLDGTVQQWFWDFGDNIKANTKQVQHLYTTAQSYNVSLYTINSQGCNSDTLTQQFVVNPYPTVDAGPDRVVLEGGSVTMQPVVTGNDLQYLWSPATYLNDVTLATPTANIILTDITYTLTVTGRGGCTAPSDNLFVKVLKAPKVPNTFTPNNDGINDLWLIDYLSTYPDCRVQVFTRSGQVVFESRGYKTPWNGTLKGKPLPFDTYYYIIEPGNGRQPITGYVTLVK